MRPSFAVLFIIVVPFCGTAARADGQEFAPDKTIETFAPSEPAPPAPTPQKRRQCLTAAETREAVGTHQLIAPMEAVRDAQALGRGELLRSRLCRWDQDFVYETTLLKHDGRVLRVFLNAKDGKPMPGKAPG